MIAKRAKKITPFMVMEILEKAQEMERKGDHVIHFEVGEPDFDMPHCIKDATQKALLDNQTHYTHSLGHIDLREAICQHYADTYGVQVDPDQIGVTSGTSPAMGLIFAVLLEVNDQVIISDPHYPCYTNLIEFVGGRAVKVPVYEEDNFQYRPEAIAPKINAKTKGILINSPSNPTGTILSGERMEKIARFAPFIISDEVYHGLVYEGQAHSILEYTDNAFVFNGFSKLYAMTGLRLGYLIAPKDFMRPIQKIMQNYLICANSIVQAAGIAALTQASSDIERMKNEYNQRRLYLLDRLKKMGFAIRKEPTGAFYVFANCRHIAPESYPLALDILEKAKISVTPGISFGENGEGYIRFSYANSIDNIRVGMDRLEAYLADRQKVQK